MGSVRALHLLVVSSALAPCGCGLLLDLDAPSAAMDGSLPVADSAPDTLLDGAAIEDPFLGARRIAMASRFACSIEAQAVYCWGSNEYGQIGIAPSAPVPTPMRVAVPDAVRVYAASADDEAETAEPEANAVCASLELSGALVCWGLNTGGVAALPPSSWAPPTRVMLPDADADAALGGHHACSVLASHAVWCWGRNTYGQLGTGAALDVPAPPSVVVGLDANRIAAGLAHTCAVLRGGGVACWGRNDSGQLGVGAGIDMTARPMLVAGITDARDVAAGNRFTCAALMSGRVMCWGQNRYGELGVGDTIDHSSPIEVSALGDAAQISAGHEHACVRHWLSSIACWGQNEEGELADLALGVYPAPEERPDLVGVPSAGFHATCMRTVDRSVWCWGLNDQGQLGDGTFTTRSTPAPVPGLP